MTLPLRPDAEIPGTEDSASATLEFLIPKGLVVTREFPEVIRERYNIQVTPIIWLTESPGEMRIAPTSLAMLTDTIIRFMESNPNSIVLLEGVEYLVTFNDFKRVLKALDSLNETAWITKSRLLVAVHPKAFEERDLALLERDRKVLRGAADIEELKRELADVRGNAEGLIYTAEKSLEEYGHVLTDQDREDIAAYLAELKSVMEGSDIEATREAIKKLEAASHRMAEAMYAEAAESMGEG